MKWSYKLGRMFGIDVHVHATFLFLLGVIALDSYSETHSGAAVFFSLLFIVALFCLVVLHEYGHALTARHFGIRTLHITLYPIGGVAMLEGMPKRPREQLLVALAGPAVNFALAGLCFAAMTGLGQPLLRIGQLDDHPSSLLSALFFTNMVMGGFNLLPALPMDGGRVLRALLAMRLGPATATRIAAGVAKLVAVLMAAYAVLGHGHGMLLVIAVTVWLGSSAEARMASRPVRLDRSRGGPADSDGVEVLDSRAVDELLAQRPPPGAPFSPQGTDGVRVGGLRVELVDTPDGPRMRYSRVR
jgi:Zn-dependent protease